MPPETPVPHQSPDDGCSDSLYEACERFEAAWADDHEPSLEDFLGSPSEPADAEVLRELLRVEIWHRRRRGQTPVAEDYRVRFPDAWSAIEEAFRREAAKDTPTFASTRSAAAPLRSGGEKGTAASSPLPASIGRYQVLGLAGSGGFGDVYLGFDESLRRRVAIKVPRKDRFDDPALAETFLTEARVLAQLDHPGILPVYDFGRLEDGRCYLVSKLIDGEDLATILRKRRPGHGEAATLIATVAEAIHFAHKSGLVHRDLKPANILLESNGNPVLVDFGLSLREQDTTAESGWAGTPAYMSPEQARGEANRVDGRSDLFSLAAILYELLTGRRPFLGKSLAELCQRIANSDVKPPRQVDDTIPPELERICLKAMARNITARYTTARDFATDLRHYLASQRPSPSPTPSREPAPNRELSPWNFSAYLAQKRQGFLGREWLFTELDAWSRENPCERALLILGDPGSGKSAFLAHLIGRLPDRQLLAFHFCQAETPSTLEPGRIVRSLAAMLAEREPAYRAQLEVPDVRAGLDEKACQNDPAGTLERSLLAPLQTLTHDGEEVAYILIDALDEALLHSGPVNLVDLLAQRLDGLPPWIRLIMTSRKDSRVLEQLAGLRTCEIEPSESRNQADIARYVQQRLSSGRLREQLRSAGQPAEAGLATLCELSAGNFLCARQVLDGLERGNLKLSELQKLAPGLNGLYLTFFRRDFPDAAEFAEIRRLLEVMLAACEPLTEDQLAEMTGLDLDEQLPHLLDRLAVYLHRQPNADGRSCFTLFHKSLADWLTDPQRRGKGHCASVRAGHQAIANSCWNQYQAGVTAMSPYALRYAAFHLLVDRRWRELECLLLDLAYLEAKAEAGLVVELARDFARASQQVPVQDPSRRVFEFIEEAITRDLHFLLRHPETIFQCLWNTCWWHDAPAAAAYFEPPSEDQTDADPATDAGLHGILENWHTQKQFRHPGRYWVRSLRPPQTPLGVGQRQVLKGHTKAVRCVTYSPCGKRIYSGSEDHTVRVWDVGSGRELQCLTGHEATVINVACSADGRILISAAIDDTVLVWDPRTGEEVSWLRVPANDAAGVWGTGAAPTAPSVQPSDRGFVRCADISADGQRIAVGLKDGTISVRETVSGRLVHVLEGHSLAVFAVAFSHDGKLLFSGSRDKTVRIWEVTDGRQIACCEGHAGWVLRLAVSPDDSCVASASGDNTIRIWDATTGRLRRCLKGHEDSVRGIAFSPDGRQLSSGSHDQTIRLWDVEAGGQVRCWRGHTAPVTCIAHAPHQGGFASGSEDKSIRLWDPLRSSAERRRNGDGDESIRCVAFSPDGRSIATGLGRVPKAFAWDLSQSVLPEGVAADRECGTPSVPILDAPSVRIWDAQTGRLLRQILSPGYCQALAFSPDGTRVAGTQETVVPVWDGRRMWTWICTPQEQQHHVRVWDAETGAEVGRMISDYAVSSVAFSPDNRRLLALDYRQRVKIFDVQTFTELSRFHAVGPKTWHLAKQAKRMSLVGLCEHGAVYIWDTLTCGRLHFRAGRGEALTCAAVSMDGQLVLAGSDHGVLLVWDFADSRVCHHLTGHGGTVNWVACSPLSNVAATGSIDGTVRIWDLDSRKQAGCLDGHADWVTCVAFSPDGRRVASGSRDGTARVWDLDTMRELRRFDGHAASVTGVAFSPDGRRLATSSRDYRVRLWDVVRGRELACDHEAHETANAVAFSNDGQLMAAGWDGGRVRIWDATMQQMRRCVAVPDMLLDEIAFSANNQQVLAVQSNRRLLVVWDVATGRIVHRVSGTERKVDGLSSALDGRFLVGWLAGMPIAAWDAETYEQFNLQHSWDRRALRRRGIRLRNAPPRDLRSSSDRPLAPALIPSGPAFVADAGDWETAFAKRHGSVIAWYPEPLSKLEASPDGLTWAGVADRQLHLLRLEQF